MQLSNEKQEMNLQVTEGLTVAVFPNSNHEFLMPAKQVAHGYGVGIDTIRRHRKDHKTELIEGKHFISSVSIPHGAGKHGASRTTMWTKRGIVRLGFFIKSERARMFRDWAEELVLDTLNKKAAAKSPKKLPGKGNRNHNRLSAERLVGIMADVAKIEDKHVRESLTEKLIGGYGYGEV
jgi:hypothetical protein